MSVIQTGRKIANLRQRISIRCRSVAPLRAQAVLAWAGGEFSSPSGNMKKMIQFNTRNGSQVRREIDLDELDDEPRELLIQRLDGSGEVRQVTPPAGRIVAASPAIHSLLVALERDQDELGG